MRGFVGDLGANPISEGLNACGELAIKVLLLSLACTPIRSLTGASWPIRIRKSLGLLAFTYALLHLLTYVVLDQRGDVRAVVRDVFKRPFIAFGMSAFLLLVPLAVTSTKGMLQRLGAKNWQRLHKLVYLASVLAIIHYIMRQKEDITVPVIHGAVLAVLFAVRIVDAFKRRSMGPKRRAPAQTTRLGARDRRLVRFCATQIASRMR